MAGVTRDKDRHGNVRLYFRVRGRPKIRLKEKEGTPAFEDELACARLGIPYIPKDGPAKARIGRENCARVGTFRWLVEQYLTRHVAGQAAATRVKKRAVLEEMCEETILSQSGAPLGHMAYAGLELRHVAMLRDVKVGLPEAANHRVKLLSAMFGWAVGAGLAAQNPAEGCQKLKGKVGGHHTLTRDEIALYEARHPFGSKAHLAMTIFRYTGLRICDAAVFGRQHLYSRELEDGTIERRFRITATKTAHSSGLVVDMPLLPPLAEAIDALPASTNLAFLQTDFRKPFSVKGLGQWMRKRFDEAKLPHCSSHGIRKADAVIAAENGATSKELQAMFAWTSSREADRYTQAAERQKLASSGAPRLID